MRAVRVRLDVMTNKHFLLSFAAAAVAVAIAMVRGDCMRISSEYILLIGQRRFLFTFH